MKQRFGTYDSLKAPSTNGGVYLDDEFVRDIEDEDSGGMVIVYAVMATVYTVAGGVIGALITWAVMR